MTSARKFAFETEFTPDGVIVRDAPKRLTPEEIEAQCALAYERGKQDAVAQAEADAAAALEALADAASAVLSHLEAEGRAMREEAARIAFVAARKIAEHALDAFGSERAAAAIEAAMNALRHQPRLVVKLSPQAAETLKPRIEQMRETHAYAAAVLVRADDAIRNGEVIVDWSDGVIVSNLDDAITRIHTLIDAALVAAASAQDTP
jgi:flagellar assembly protein FliH